MKDSDTGDISVGFAQFSGHDPSLIATNQTGSADRHVVPARIESGPDSSEPAPPAGRAVPDRHIK